MDDLLLEIFYREQEKSPPELDSIQGYCEARQLLDPYLQKVERALGGRFVDELLDRGMALTKLEIINAYRQGFHLAGQLTLELFGTRP